jgi:hypothetical protein
LICVFVDLLKYPTGVLLTFWNILDKGTLLNPPAAYPKAFCCHLSNDCQKLTTAPKTL